jgi:bacterioferritin-associated ferredoxin
MYVCLCKGITESDVRRITLAGVSTAEELVASFGLEDEECCGRCAKNIYELVSIATGNRICGSSKSLSSCTEGTPSLRQTFTFPASQST